MRIYPPPQNPSCSHFERTFVFVYWLTHNTVSMVDSELYHCLQIRSVTIDVMSDSPGTDQTTAAKCA